MLALKRVACKTELRNIVLFTDSQAAISMLRIVKYGPAFLGIGELDGWSRGSLAEYWLTTLMYKLKIALEPFNEVFVVWGRGHTTNRRGLVASMNRAADEMANQAASQGLRSLGMYDSLAGQVNNDGASGVNEAPNEGQEPGLVPPPQARDIERLLETAERNDVEVVSVLAPDEVPEVPAPDDE